MAPEPPASPKPPAEDIDSLTVMVARREAYAVIKDHLALCPFAKLDIEQRLRTVEINYARLVGFMAGSGILGGAAGGLLTRLLDP